MDKDIAKILVEGMGTKSGGVVLEEKDRKRLIDSLTDVYIPKGVVSLELPYTSHFSGSIEETGILGDLFLRRVISNKIIMSIPPASLFKRTYEGLREWFGVYSSGEIMRRLHRDRRLINEMNNSSMPYSLLVKFRTIDCDTDEVVIGPLLVAPGVSRDLVRRWEEANTKEYSISRYLLVPRLSEIRAEALNNTY